MELMYNFRDNVINSTPWITLLGTVAIVAYLLNQLWRSYHARSVGKAVIDEKRIPDTLDPYHVEPLVDFDWRTTEPIKFRNFKPKYHLTMGLIDTPFSDLTLIDSNYLLRMQHRAKVIAENHSTAVQASPTVAPAVNELYTWLTHAYLPVRFPTLFVPTTKDNLTTPTTTTTTPPTTHLLNTATNTLLPLLPPTTTTTPSLSNPTITALTTLGHHLDEDILLLLPSPDGDGYDLQGYVVCNASGFDPREKFGLKLRDIHGPVPGYERKLGRSMDRFFERLEVGRLVCRNNWMIQTHPHLFAVDDTAPCHIHPDEPIPPTDTHIDISQTYFRCERQTLHRLPHTKALVFMFKTYIYPIADLKAEGYGEELAQAIEGLREGSVPEMWVYKRGVVWGEGVMKFLRE